MLATKDELKMIEEFLSFSPIRFLAKKYNTTSHFIFKILDRHGIPRPGKGQRPHNFISEEIEKAIIDDFRNGASFLKISKDRRLPYRRIQEIFKKKNISPISPTNFARKYTVNDNFFAAPESWGFGQGYYLGWILSDGHISKNLNGVSIGIHEKDIAVLEFLKKSIEYTGPIAIQKRKTKLDPGWRSTGCIAKLQITDKKIKSDLLKLADFEYKTFTLEWPPGLPDRLNSSFLLGFWEGDGCFVCTERAPRTPSVGIISTIKMSEAIQRTLSNLGIRSAVARNKRLYGESPIAILTITGQLNCVRFMNFIYKDAEFVLRRKFDKYRKFLKDFSISSRSEGGLAQALEEGKKLTDSISSSMGWD